YETAHLQGLSNGQVILLGTDGIWEAQNPRGERLGKDPICEVLREHAAESATDILQSVFNRLEVFQQGAKKEDDITAVVIKVEASAAGG
ncbi:MAG: SpoIIE family protein phosphatase, partial [Deltaproteobacteria bacterium]|nr:SpoIIE family protein phosphatase [Deltaproteobacteria bacterium]